MTGFERRQARFAPGLKGMRHEARAERVTAGLVIFVVLFFMVTIASIWFRDWKKYFYFSGDLQSLLLVAAIGWVVVHSILYVMKIELKLALR
ncbi:MAG TPA: hypothetical protein VJA40_01870 [archaeon]|nr:hypothetical protein [archaeon]